LITDNIALSFYEYIVGNTTLMALLIITIVIIMLLAIKAGKVVILMLMIPLITTMMIPTSFIEIPKYSAVLMWIIAGLIFGGAIIAYAYRS